jgi:hypothetical protein
VVSTMSHLLSSQTTIRAFRLPADTRIYPSFGDSPPSAVLEGFTVLPADVRQILPVIFRVSSLTLHLKSTHPRTQRTGRKVLYKSFFMDSLRQAEFDFFLVELVPNPRRVASANTFVSVRQESPKRQHSKRQETLNEENEF